MFAIHCLHETVVVRWAAKSRIKFMQLKAVHQELVKCDACSLVKKGSCRDLVEREWKTTAAMVP